MAAVWPERDKICNDLKNALNDQCARLGFRDGSCSSVKAQKNIQVQTFRDFCFRD